MHVTDERPPVRDVVVLEERTERLVREISVAKQDWERKRSDPGVPGALEPDEDDDAA